MANYTPVQIANRTAKGISNLTLKRNSTKELFVFPKPQSFVIDEGLDLRDVTGNDQLGESGYLFTYTKGKQPSLQITYGVMQPEMYAVQSGYMRETGTLNNVKVPFNGIVPETGITPAAQPGFFREAIVKDANASASIIVDNVSTSLLQVGYDSFVATDDNTFAVGDKGEIKWSKNLYDPQQQYFNIEIDADIAGSYIGSELIGDLTISATIVSSINTIWYVQCPFALINPSGVTFDAAAEQLQLNFRLATYDGCRAYNLLETSEQVEC